MPGAVGSRRVDGAPGVPCPERDGPERRRPGPSSMSMPRRVAASWLSRR